MRMRTLRREEMWERTRLTSWTLTWRGVRGGLKCLLEGSSAFWCGGLCARRDRTGLWQVLFFIHLNNSGWDLIYKHFSLRCEHGALPCVHSSCLVFVRVMLCGCFERMDNSRCSCMISSVYPVILLEVLKEVGDITLCQPTLYVHDKISEDY